MQGMQSWIRNIRAWPAAARHARHEAAHECRESEGGGCDDSTTMCCCGGSSTRSGVLGATAGAGEVGAGEGGDEDGGGEAGWIKATGGC